MKIKTVATWSLGLCLFVLAWLILKDANSARAFGGPLSARDQSILRTVGLGAGLSFIPLILPTLISIAKQVIAKFTGGGGTGANDLGSLVNLVETILGMFGGKLSAAGLLDMFRQFGLPTWFYVGGSWGPDKTYALHFGQVPTPLPVPKAPAPAEVVNTVKAVAPAPAATVVATPAEGVATA